MSISQTKRRRIMVSNFDNYNGRCPVCSVQLQYKRSRANEETCLATIDHIVPRAHGGTDVSDNLFVLCVRCNTTRNDKSFVNFAKGSITKEEAKKIVFKAFVANADIRINGKQNANMRTKCGRQSNGRKKNLPTIVKWLWMS